MLHRFRGLISVGALTICPVWADIINVSVDGSVSGTVSVTVACAISTPGCVQVGPNFFRLTNSDSFSATNTTLGPFGDSASVTGAPSFSDAFATGFADQDTSATSDSVSITLMGGHAALGPSYTASESDSISVSFDLTAQSLVELNGGALGMASDVGTLVDSKGNVIVTIPNLSLPVFANLGPGTYTLQASASGGGSGTAFGYVDATDFELGLDATLTPVPEPPGTLLGIMLAGAVSSYALLRGRHKGPAPRV